MVEGYRNNFKSSSQFDKPKELLAISVLCTDTEEKARQMRHFLDYILIMFEKGRFDKFGSCDQRL